MEREACFKKFVENVNSNPKVWMVLCVCVYMCMTFVLYNNLMNDVYVICFRHVKSSVTGG